ncbi:alpha/beta hydrolase [Orbaceae bacterium ESL0727]|nr:alpha/beta hydrolase [Orbaceae bacterium ESL0727]
MAAIQNLSETLFKPKFNYPETSTLIKRIDISDVTSQNTGNNCLQTHPSPLDGGNNTHWYRLVNPLLWHFRGLSTVEIEDVLSRIAVSTKPHSHDNWLDTVIGYQAGNWIYEFLNQAATWQAESETIIKADLSPTERQKMQRAYLMASEYGSIASYPHYKSDELALYAQTYAYKAYSEALNYSPYLLKELEFQTTDNLGNQNNIKAMLHLPIDAQTTAEITTAYPAVLLCGGMGNLQIDFYRYFSEFLAPKGIALITVDFPSVGLSRQVNLTQNTSQIYQTVLEQLPTVPWIDARRVVLTGIRFGSNIATRLAYLMPNSIKGLLNITPLIHQLFINKTLQESLPTIYKDMVASRLGLDTISNQQLAAELCCFSLKNQGIINRPCHVPVMSILFEDDPLSTMSEAKLITSCKQHKIVTIARTPLQKNFQKAMIASTDWMLSLL